MAHDNEFTLMKERRFLPFFVTQFLGAFNDNVFKNALVIVLAFHATSWTTLSTGMLAMLAKRRRRRSIGHQSYRNISTGRHNATHPMINSPSASRS